MTSKYLFKIPKCTVIAKGGTLNRRNHGGIYIYEDIHQSKVGFFPTKDMRTPPPSQKWPSLHERCAMSYFSDFLLVVKDVTIRLRKKKEFKSGQIYREDAD